MSDNREHQLALFSALFTRTDKDAYEALVEDASWRAFLADASPALSQALARPLGHEAYRHFFNRMLTPGMPGALPPVESLYKDWGGHVAGLQHGQGYYLGEAALHMREVCSALGVQIPLDYQATPDHLVLLLELLGYLCEYAPAQDACDFAQHHFDWLDEYRSLLVRRSCAQEDDALAQAGEFYGYVLDYINQFVSRDVLLRQAHRIVGDVSQEESRNAEEVVLQ